jgi:hypothetical protein
LDRALLDDLLAAVAARSVTVDSQRTRAHDF